MLCLSTKRTYFYCLFHNEQFSWQLQNPDNDSTYRHVLAPLSGYLFRCLLSHYMSSSSLSQSADLRHLLHELNNVKISVDIIDIPYSLSMSVLYVIRAMIIQRMHFMYFNLQWNHHYSWGTKVHGFEGNRCPRFYISTKRITNICLKVFLKLPRFWYQRNIVPTNQNNFRYPRTLTPTKIMTLQ